MREWYNTGVPDGSKKEEKIITGFIAQDLKEVQEKHDMKYLNLVYESNPEKLEATPGNLLPPLVKSVQELTALVKTQQKETEELSSDLQVLIKANQELSNVVKVQQQEIYNLKIK
jgi:hypothetical protein